MTVASRDPPGPKARFPGALILAYRRDPLGLFERTARQYGDVALLRLGRNRIYLLNHPEFVKDVPVQYVPTPPLLKY